MSNSLLLSDVANRVSAEYFKQLVVESLFRPSPIWERLTNNIPLERDWIVEIPRNADGSIDFDRVEL